MTTFVFGTGSKLVRGCGAQHDFSYSVTETPLSISGSTTPVVVQDANTNYTSGSSIDNNFRINVADSISHPGHSFVNKTPAIVSVDSVGNVTKLAAGVASIDIATKIGARNYQRTMSTGANASYAFVSYVAGSLGKHITDAVNTMISGKTAGSATQALWTSNNNSTTSPSGTRNASLFSGIDLSAISMTRSGVEYFPGNLISPRHIIGANHAMNGLTGPFVWKDSTGAYHTASVVSAYGNVNTDLWIGYLSAPITGITPFSILPANWLRYMPSLQSSSMGLTGLVPSLLRGYHKPDGTAEVRLGIQTVTTFGPLLNIAAIPASSPFYPWYSPIVGGDSDSPLIWPINGAPVLVSSLWTTSQEPSYADLATTINQQMNALASAQGDATSYSIGIASLAGFTSW